MKRLFILFFIFLTFACDCESYNSKSDSKSILPSGVKIESIEFEGHEYIIASYIGHKDGGISIIHSESCKCKNK